MVVGINAETSSNDGMLESSSENYERMRENHCINYISSMV
ncbi:MAG: hypothetical protein ACI9Z3_001144 [Roseivirga sp.]